jgi:hypothetical protein
MSGGHYDYATFDLNRVVEKLQEGKGLSVDSEKCRRKLVKIVEKIARLVYDLEWYDSGDYGEQELQKLIKKLEKVRV